MECNAFHGWELIARIGGGEPSLDDDDDDYVTTRSFRTAFTKKTLLHNRQNDVDVNNTRNTRQQQLNYLLS